jgi:methionyl-tRNA formyltransferase
MNTIIRESDFDVKVIVGAKNNKIKKKKVLTMKVFKNRAINAVFSKYGKRFNDEKFLTEEFYFKNSKLDFEFAHSKHLLTTVEPSDNNINDQKFVKIIRDFQPEILLVMGAIIISSEIINLAKYSINLHTGLSPYYRGAHSNLWPFINNDFAMCGFTIHLLTPQIDSGAIIHSQQINVNRNSTFSGVNCEAIVSGTKITTKILHLLSLGHQIFPVVQWEKGLYYKTRDWNNLMAFRYYKKLIELGKDTSESKNLRANNIIKTVDFNQTLRP